MNSTLNPEITKEGIRCLFKNICLEVEYMGTDYFGFQLQDKKQSKEITVQEVLEKALKQLFRHDIRITFASRTDRGVHAYGQVVNFKVNTAIPLVNIKRALNSFLPSDIRIKKIKRVPLLFHARFSVDSKVYRYVIFNRKTPSVFERDFSWYIEKSLDIERMKKISLQLIGKKDFFLFAKKAHRYEHCVREIKAISFRKRGSFIWIEIEGDGFLRYMVRNIVSFFVQVGTKTIELSGAMAILKGKLPYRNYPAPAQGLYLLKVNYAKCKNV